MSKRSSDSTSSRVFALLALLGVAIAILGLTILWHNTRVADTKVSQFLKAAIYRDRATSMRERMRRERAALRTIERTPRRVDASRAGCSNSSSCTLNVYWTRSDEEIYTLMNLHTRVVKGESSSSTAHCIRAISEGEVVGNAGISEPRAAPRSSGSGATGGGGYVYIQHGRGLKKVRASSSEARRAKRKAERRRAHQRWARTRMIDSPPITFASDGTITAQTAEIIREAGLEPQENAFSTWSDIWKAYVDGENGEYTQETSLVRCSTQNDFAVICTVDSSLSDDVRVRLEVHRTITPFLLGGTLAPNSERSKVMEGTMVASRYVTITELKDAANCATQTPTPTPTPFTTTPPEIIPTFTPGPTPTGGDSSGEDIFWED